MRSRFAALLVTLPLALALACSAHTATAPAEPLGPDTREGLAADAWWNGAVFYEVFVRSFQDSNGDGKGDLAGLIARLDYLRDAQPGAGEDLEVDAIWLMPIFESPSYHGYDTVDYERIEQDYGTNADFDRLIEEAHARGLRVIVDLVVNHTSSQHPWFTESASPSSQRRDWYVWSPTDRGWTQPFGSGRTWHPLNGAWYYGVFWSGMPDLNYGTAAVRDEMKRIAAFWLGRGVDGFRLDAVRYLLESGPGPGQSDTPETLAYWKEFAAYVRSVKPDAVLVGEAWTETPAIARYYGSTTAVAGGDILPMNFDFPLAGAILQGVEAGSATPIAAQLASSWRTFPRGATDVPFLTNHDQARVASRTGWSAARLKNAAAILLTLPGSPFIYYGEEIGMRNGPGGEDEHKRLPMAWDATATGGFTSATAPWSAGFGAGGYAPGKDAANVALQSSDASSLLSRYRALIRARQASPALRRGEATLLTPPGASSPTLALLRAAGGEQVLVIHNLTDGPVTTASLGVTGSAAEPIFVDAGAEVAPDAAGWTVRLPARASGVWKVR